MRLIAFLLSFAWTNAHAQDWKASLQQTLESRYTLTKLTADRVGIGAAGAVVVLEKDNLAMGASSTPIVVPNTYKDGKITQGLFGKINRLPGLMENKTFGTGDKLLVTRIDVREDGVVFELLSDSPDGPLYRSSLRFPLAKSSPPAPDRVEQVVAQVLKVDAAAETAQTSPKLPQVNPEAPIAGTPAPDNTGWDPRYGRMTSDDLRRINNATVRFDLNYFRLNPAALDQKPVMQYFIALNNCNDLNIERALFNELDYSALAAFYKSKAPQILASLPRTVSDVALYRYIGGHQSGNWILWSKSLTLGEYDPRRKAFPLKYPGRDSVEIPDSLSTENKGRELAKGCPAAAKAARGVNSYLPTAYVISLKPAVYRELPMEEDAARKYIDRATPPRSVFLVLDVTILDSPPNISRANNNTISQVSFRAQTARIRVIDASTVKPLGTLFDDHSLPAEVQVAQAPPPPPAKPADRWAFGDHMYEIRTAVYVFLASDACGWPLTAEQSANLRGFVDRMSTKGNFNERYQYNLADSKTKNTINANGRHGFCADAAERRKFDQLAATIAPLGPLAAPSSR